MSFIQCSRHIRATRGQVFDYMLTPENLAHLLSDHFDVEVVSQSEELKPHSEFAFRMTRFGLTQVVRYCVNEVVNGKSITYRQTEGIFPYWVHTQKFEEQEGGTIVTDLVEYEMPLGFVGNMINDFYLRKDLKTILNDRLKKADDHFS